MVKLRRMTDQEYQRFKEYSINDYAKDLIEGRSLDWDQALANAQKEFDTELPKGKETAGQFLMSIEDTRSGSPVGWIWFLYEENDNAQQVWINDFLIYANQRQKGYGTAALTSMEQMAKRDGCVISVLHIWDHNTEGYSLYKKCGYITVKHIEGGSVMKKNL